MLIYDAHPYVATFVSELQSALQIILTLVKSAFD
jgi:hypothetical protein